MEKYINNQYAVGKFNTDILNLFHEPTEEESRNILKYYLERRKRNNRSARIIITILSIFDILMFLTAINKITNKEINLAIVMLIITFILFIVIISLYKDYSKKNIKTNHIISKQYTIAEVKVSDIRIPKTYTAPGTCEIQVKSETIKIDNLWFLVRNKDVKKDSSVLLMYTEIPINSSKKDIEFRAFTPHMFTKQGMRENLTDTPMSPL